MSNSLEEVTFSIIRNWTQTSSNRSKILISQSQEVYQAYLRRFSPLAPSYSTMRPSFSISNWSHFWAQISIGAQAIYDSIKRKSLSDTKSTSLKQEKSVRAAQILTSLCRRKRSAVRPSSPRRSISWIELRRESSQTSSLRERRELVSAPHMSSSLFWRVRYMRPTMVRCGKQVRKMEPFSQVLQMCLRRLQRRSKRSQHCSAWLALSSQRAQLTTSLQIFPFQT